MTDETPTSIKTEIIKDFSGNQIVITRSQPVGEILEENMREYNDTANQQDMGFGRKVASVPQDVLDQWILEGVDYRLVNRDPEMAKKFKAKLNSPEFRYFRTHNSRL